MVGKRLLYVQAALPEAGGRFNGSWKLDARDADVAPFALGRALPVFTASGEGRVVADPQLAVYTSPGNIQIASNDNWSDNANAAQIAANSGFPLAAGSKDAALLLTLDPGTYTVQVSGVGNTTGIALVEVYEITN